jgi:hypothetical protein
VEYWLGFTASKSSWDSVFGKRWSSSGYGPSLFAPIALIERAGDYSSLKVFHFVHDCLFDVFGYGQLPGTEDIDTENRSLAGYQNALNRSCSN